MAMKWKQASSCNNKLSWSGLSVSNHWTGFSTGTGMWDWNVGLECGTGMWDWI